MKNTNVPTETKGTLHLTLVTNGKTVNIEEDTIVSGSPTFRSGTSESDEISVGAAIISGFDFTVFNDSGVYTGLDWYGSTVHAEYEIAGITLDMGDYYVTQHSEQGYTISITCYDGMKFLDEYQIYEDSISYPADALDIIKTIAANRGLSVSGGVSGITVEDPGDDTMTERSVLSCLAQMMGRYAIVKNSTLYLKWYDLDTVYDAGTTFSHDLQTKNVTVTGVKVTSYDGETIAKAGSETNMIEISDNPFITADNAQTAADLINSSVNGMTFRPGTVSILSNPAIEAGDVLQVQTGQESNIIMIATTVTFKTSALQESITADAEPYSGDLRINQSDYIKKKAKEAVSEALADAGIGSDSGDGEETTVETCNCVDHTVQLVTICGLTKTDEDDIGNTGTQQSMTIISIDSDGTISTSTKKLYQAMDDFDVVAPRCPSTEDTWDKMGYTSQDSYVKDGTINATGYLTAEPRTFYNWFPIKLRIKLATSYTSSATRYYGYIDAEAQWICGAFGYVYSYDEFCEHFPQNVGTAGDGDTWLGSITEEIFNTGMMKPMLEIKLRNSTRIMQIVSSTNANDDDILEWISVPITLYLRYWGTANALYGREETDDVVNVYVWFPDATSRDDLGTGVPCSQYRVDRDIYTNSNGTVIGDFT